MLEVCKQILRFIQTAEDLKDKRTFRATKYELHRMFFLLKFISDNMNLICYHSYIKSESIKRE